MDSCDPVVEVPMPDVVVSVVVIDVFESFRIADDKPEGVKLSLSFRRSVVCLSSVFSRIIAGFSTSTEP